MKGFRGFDKIKTPYNWKINVVEKAYYSEEKGIRNRRNIWSGMTVVLTSVFAAVLLISGTLFAYEHFTGSDFFKQFYLEKAEDMGSDADIDYGIIDNTASSTAGIVYEDEKFCIEVLGAMASGNMAQIMLKVTVYELDSVLIEDNDWPTQPNYVFHDMEFVEQEEFFLSSSSQYFYSDMDSTLKDNQFKVLYGEVHEEKFEETEYDFKIGRLGYVEDGNFNFSYDDTWNLTIDLTRDDDQYRESVLNEEYIVGEYNITIEDYIITPFTCTVNLSSDVYDEDFTSAVTDKLQIILKSGKILLNNVHYRMYTVSYNEKAITGYKHTIEINFVLPQSIADIQMLKFDEIEIFL